MNHISNFKQKHFIHFIYVLTRNNGKKGKAL